VTKRASRVGSSTGTSSVLGASSSGNNQEGKEESTSQQTWSLWKPWTWLKWGKGDEKDDEDKPPGGYPPLNSGPSSDPEMVPHKYTVNIYPNEGRTFRGGRQIQDEIKTTSISPNLEIVFFQNKTRAKFLKVTTQTQCNLGFDAHRQDFGWFQDDIKISFEGISPECKKTTLKNPRVTTENDEEPIPIKETTQKSFGGLQMLRTNKESLYRVHLWLQVLGCDMGFLKMKQKLLRETFWGLRVKKQQV
jgi:hypothetical protein